MSENILGPSPLGAPPFAVGYVGGAATIDDVAVFADVTGYNIKDGGVKMSSKLSLDGTLPMTGQLDMGTHPIANTTSVTPATTNTSDLGSSLKRYRTLYGATNLDGPNFTRAVDDVVACDHTTYVSGNVSKFADTTGRTIKDTGFTMESKLSADGTVALTGALVPATTGVTDLGSASKKFRTIYYGSLSPAPPALYYACSTISTTASNTTTPVYLLVGRPAIGSLVFPSPGRAGMLIKLRTQLGFALISGTMQVEIVTNTTQLTTFTVTSPVTSTNVAIDSSLLTVGTPVIYWSQTQVFGSSTPTAFCAQGAGAGSWDQSISNTIDIRVTFSVANAGNNCTANLTTVEVY